MCESQRKHERPAPDGRRPVTVGVGALRRRLRVALGPTRGQDGRLEAGLRAQLVGGRRGPLEHRGGPLGRRRRALLVPLLRRRTANLQREFRVVVIQHSTCVRGASVQRSPRRSRNLGIHSNHPRFQVRMLMQFQGLFSFNPFSLSVAIVSMTWGRR